MNEETSPRILVVDDERDMLETCRKMLSFGSYRVDVSEQAQEALRLYRERRHDLVILDLKMPEMNGLELMERLHQIKKDQLVVMITAYASAENAIQAVQSGAFDFVRKPFKMDDLLVIVERALRFKALRDENRKLQDRLDESFRAEKIVGKSPVLKDALVKLQKVCEVDVPVLICGESGTGKELFARTIHENSLRKEQLFLAVDCAALPELLLESELFGYEKGAFTGAVQSKAGLFEVASRGTVFLDEIGEMSLNLQAKLLRFLQEHCVRRLGGNQERQVDVRILAATHRDIEVMVQEGQLREDLYYRINVVCVTVPPLREREGDVPLLANHFFNLFRSKVRKNLEGISAAAMLILEEYDWPGNVRELCNTIERACTLTESTQILPQDLSPSLLSAVEEQKSVTGSGDFQEAKRALIGDFEREYLIKMLIRTSGNVTEAARFCGLSRPAFHRLMSKYEISSLDFKDNEARDID
ncbi:sigma-54 dependent transcriptional regulator [Acidobacteria bacterium AH-259-D05]|nr:sigma-54 dependent transcriptional regulator [Acidobacteria bacterium AH-259-D05]